MERKRKQREGDDSDEEVQSRVIPPITDIYRTRQQKRAHTVQLLQNS